MRTIRDVGVAGVRSARLLAVALALLLVASSAPAQVVAVEGGFELHSGFWINLHHFLYQQAYWRKAAASDDKSVAAMARERLAKTDALTEAERRDWSAALDYYAASVIDRDLLFDEGMVAIKAAVAAAEGKPSLAGAGLDDGLRRALELAAPVYRAAWWPEHDRLNRTWIERVRPLVKKYHDELASGIAAAFREKWPPAPVRVDVAYFAHRLGAYSTDRPLHVTVSSTHPQLQGDYALEILFHETSHALVDRHAGAVGLAIEREAKAQKREAPERLWHMVLFYTTGEMVRRAFEHAGATGYVPYAYKYGLYERSPEAEAERRALEAHWQPYLDGKLGFDEAIKRLVAATAK
jgi:hypothetical protein